MEILKDRYTITELSARLSVTDHALRYYEREFGLNIPKDERGRRYYTPELANIMFQIKRMRDEGLEIKAIKKILISEDIIKEPPPVVMEDSSMPIISSTQTLHNDTKNNQLEIKQILDDLQVQITNIISDKIEATQGHLSNELLKAKLELGACVENSARKLETKLEKHFQEVDRSLTSWREKKQHQSFFKRLFHKR